MKKYYLTLLILVFTLIFQPDLMGQVTIGSGATPNSGALLDIKQYEDQTAEDGGRTALGGLGLPRVKLSKLRPQSPAELSASIDGTGNWDLTEHVGLTVYAVGDECLSTPVENGVYVFDGKEWQFLGKKSYIQESAGNSDRSDWESAWGTKTIVHGEKKDASGNVIYKEFVSSDFGQAGRWMTTNVAAFQYDTDLAQEQHHSAGRKLIGPNGNADDKLDVAYWAYPKLSGSSVVENENPSEQFLENPYIGLLYTWDAATAGKGGANGQLNVDNPNQSADSYENGLPEWDGTGVQPANTQKRRQGICPKGWHVPSDYEWTELEREMIRNTSLYADMDNIDNGDGTELEKVQQPPYPGSPVGEGQLALDENLGMSEELFRGSSHGIAMRGGCAVPGSKYPTGGKSSISHKGGFNMLLTGRVIITSTLIAGYGNFAMPWTSSTYVDTPAQGEEMSYVAICRNVRRDNGRVYRAAYKREYMNSVRCKKD